MQADNIEAGARDLCTKLINLNPIEAHAAINQYFDTAASLESREVNIQGAERIKKQFDLLNRAFKASDLIGQPKWSERDQTIDFTYTRLIQGPELMWPLKDLPIVGRFSRARKIIHYDGSLHLNPDGKPADGQAPNLMVTKYIVNRREQAPLENLIPYTLLRPFFSLVSNVIATVASIVLSFPFTPKGIVFMITSIINNFWLWFYDKVADVSEKPFQQKPSWADGPGSDLPVRQQLGSVLSSAEDQAKKLGIPVERAKQLAQDAYERAGQALEQVQERVKESAQKAGQATENAQSQAQNTAKDLKAQAETKAPQATEQMEDVAGDLAERGRKAGRALADKAQETKENVEDAAEGNIGDADLPRTPFGGTDPLADGSPSYADAAADDGSHAGRNTPAGAHERGSDLPSTPFGGTDPLADGAPSYAHAAAED